MLGGKKAAATVRVLAPAFGDEGAVPLFIGRDDGSIEKYARIEDADLGQPSLILRGHRGPVTGLVAVSSEEVFSCSIDGTVRTWNAADLDQLPSATATVEGGNRSVQVVKCAVPLHCLVQQASNGRLYAGGADGALHVIDGERRSAWPGHMGTITCIAFTQDELIVTGGTDNQILVWDSAEGKPFRLLMGHTNSLTGIAIVPPDEEALDADESGDGGAGDDEEFGPGFFVNPAAGAIISFARDGTAKVWSVPDPTLDVAEDGEDAWARLSREHSADTTAEAEAEEAAGAAASTGEGDAAAAPAAAAAAASVEGETPATEDGEAAAGGESAAASPTDGKRTSATVVSFQMPEGADAEGGERVQNDAYQEKRGTFEAKPIVELPTDDHDTDNAESDGESLAPVVQPETLEAILRPSTAIKSVLKAPERALLKREAALGTITLPGIPYAVFQPPDLGDDGMGDAGGAAAALVLVGSDRGTVWGIHAAAMAKQVLTYASDSRRSVAREVRSTGKLLRKSTALLHKECKKAIKTETNKIVKVADKAHRTKKKAEREKQREEQRVAAKAAAEERRRQREEYGDEEDEEGDYDDDGDGFEEDEEDEEVETEEEEADVDGEGDVDEDGTPRPKADFRLRHLSPEQREALTAFCQAREKERDEKLAELRTAVEAHLAKVRPIAKASYERSREDFTRLKYTSFASVAPSATPHTVGGSIAHVAAARRGDGGMEGDVVLAVAGSGGRVYAGQSGSVAIARLAPGIVQL